MPVLKNQKHELFCQNMAIGMGVAEAYEAAGYRPNRANASALKANQHILERLSELQMASAENVVHKVEYSRDYLLDQLEAIRIDARAAGQSSAAVAAVMGQARILGVIIDRREVGDPGEFSEMSDAELVAKAAREARELGIAGPAPVKDEDAA